MSNQLFVDSDSHIIEPADLWTDRIDKAYRDKAPRVGKIPTATGDFWLIEGVDPIPGVAGAFLGAARKDKSGFEEWSQKGEMKKDLRPGGYLPAERLKDMAQDNIGATALYPTTVSRLQKMKDGGYQSAIYRAYNDWLADFCSYDPKRFAGVGLISVLNPEEAAKEIRRCAKLGFQGGLIPMGLPLDTGYDDPSFEPLWAAFAETGMPVTIHTAPTTWWPAEKNPSIRVAIGCVDFPVRRALTDMIFGGVLDRYPSLKVVIAEFEVGWIPHFIWWTDHRFKLRPTATAPIKMLPSEYIKKHVWATVIEDPSVALVADALGEDHLLWSTDYPHVESTWPKSREYADRIFKSMPESARRKITRENALKLYRLSAN